MKKIFLIVTTLIFMSYIKVDNFQQTKLDKKLVLKLVNDYRAKGCYCGDEYFPPVPPVRLNEKLEKAAQLHSDEMFGNNFFSHFGIKYPNIWDRAQTAGYKYERLSENIAHGAILTESNVVKFWMESRGHCTNIMDGKVTEMGIAKKGNYWTQVFGKTKK